MFGASQTLSIMIYTANAPVMNCVIHCFSCLELLQLHRLMNVMMSTSVRTQTVCRSAVCSTTPGLLAFIFADDESYEILQGMPASQDGKAKRFLEPTVIRTDRIHEQVSM